nr:hypothetical protein [Tanacetum cinerariifolium]
MNQLCSTVRIDFEDSERAGPTGFKLSREYLQSRIKKQHLITNIENAVFDLVIVKLFSSFFVDERVLVSLIMKLTQLIQLKLPLTPNKPYAQSRVEGDMLCRRQDDMGYNRLKFCMQCEMPIMRLLACHSTRHGFLPPSF